MRREFGSLILFLAVAQTAFGQTNPEVFGNQIIVSPKGLETLPLSSAGVATRLSAPAANQPLATAPVPFTDAELRAISQAAGIYVPANPGFVCPPGQISCKPSPGTQEQINLVDRGPAGDVSRILEVTSKSTDAVDKTVIAINSSATREAIPNFWRRTTQQQEPQYYLQWGFAGRSTALGGANFISAWNRTRGSNATNVAVIDTGVIRTHPEIGAALLGGIDLVNIPVLAGDGDAIHRN